MTFPKRVQYRRGVKLPPDTRLVSRPSRWGNPVKIIEHDSGSWEVAPPETSPILPTLWPSRRAAHGEAVELFALTFGAAISTDDIAALKGMDLACYCPLDLPCHADVLLDWAELVPAPAEIIGSGTATDGHDE